MDDASDFLTSIYNRWVVISIPIAILVPTFIMTAHIGSIGGHSRIWDVHCSRSVRIIMAESPRAM